MTSESSFESAIESLTDLEQHLSTTRLAELSDLDPDDARALRETWPEIDAERRFRILTEMAELAADNVDLNFDAVFKTGLNDEEGYVRAAAIRGLVEYEGRDLIPALADLLLNDADADVRAEAATALGRYALACELGYLPDADGESVRDVLIESASDVEEDERVRANAIGALGALSGEETDNLIESVYQEDSTTLKIGAVDAMGRSANELWLPIVLREMENDDPEMRHAAAFAAGEIGEEEAIAPLRHLAIEDMDPEVQLAAVQALGEIGGDQARVALKSVLYEGDDSLNDAVQEALTEIAFNDNPLNPV